MKVVCIGAAGVDLFAPELARLPSSGEALYVEDLPLFVGGAAANTAIGLARLGVEVALVSRLGNDLFGDYILRYVAGYGVDVSRVTRSRQLPSSKSIALPVKGEDRRTIHCIGANAEFSTHDVDFDLVKTTAVVFIGGVGEGLDLKVLEGILEAARDAGVVKIINLTLAVTATNVDLERLQPLLAASDGVIISRDEGAALTGTRSAAAQAERFMAAGPRLLIITDGSRGALVVDEKGSFGVGTYSVDSVDQTGAGDAFNAGFIAALVEGLSLGDRLRWASAMGASATTELGCHKGLFDRRQLAEFIGSHTMGRYENEK